MILDRFGNDRRKCATSTEFSIEGDISERYLKTHQSFLRYLHSCLVWPISPSKMIRDQEALCIPVGKSSRLLCIQGGIWYSASCRGPQNWINKWIMIRDDPIREDRLHMKGIFGIGMFFFAFSITCLVFFFSNPEAFILSNFNTVQKLGVLLFQWIFPWL